MAPRHARCSSAAVASSSPSARSLSCESSSALQHAFAYAAVPVVWKAEARPRSSARHESNLGADRIGGVPPEALPCGHRRVAPPVRSSAAGKTFALDALRGRQLERAVHDFDEIGVPTGAETAWRHRATEAGFARRSTTKPAGTISYLPGKRRSASSCSSVCAASEKWCPGASGLQRRDARRPSSARGAEEIAQSAGSLENYLAWAEWMRRHAADPS
jgi:hypothetical protein